MSVQAVADTAKALGTKENIDTMQTYINFVKDNLEPMAKQINVSVEWLWHILVQQARVEAITYLIVAISMSITTGFLIRMFLKNIKKAKWGSGYGDYTIYKHKDTGEEIEYLTSDWDNRTKYIQVKRANNTNTEAHLVTVSAILGVLSIITSMVFIPANLPTIVTGIVNPEFRAIEKIVEFTKGTPKAETEVK